jgi:hypothetical protein
MLTCIHTLYYIIEFIVSFLLYGLVGFLAVLSGFRQQRGQACPVAMIVFSVFALVLSFAQVSLQKDLRLLWLEVILI